MKKKIAIIGSTGSVGVNACEVADNLSDQVEVVALAAGSNFALLAEQAHKLSPSYVAVASKENLESLKAQVPSGVKVVGINEVTCAAIEAGAELIINSVTGARGLSTSIETLKSGKVLALANKESLVAGGEMLLSMVKEFGGTILPIDSEHSAIFQSMLSGKRNEIERITITASGGPFRKRENLEDVTLEEALNHPTWSMGPKITIDSATLMNKALEVIEAHWLFDLPAKKINVVVHPQSIIHGMAEFIDGSVIAQLGNPDMKLPIQYAITYPERAPLGGKRLDLAELSRLDFENVDRKKFPAIVLAEEVIISGGNTGAAFNAANEEAVNAFLEKRLKFTDIVRGVSHILESHVNGPADLDGIAMADTWARKEISEWIAAR